jgi:hypothetical protein
MGRRAGSAGRQRTIPRPPDLTAAPARTCKFMFPAALANRLANETGACAAAHRLRHGCISMRHTRLAETSSIAAMRDVQDHQTRRVLWPPRAAAGILTGLCQGTIGQPEAGAATHVRLAADADPARSPAGRPRQAPRRDRAHDAHGGHGQPGGYH